MTKKQKIICKYSNNILELADHKDELTRGDFQGNIEAQVSMLFEEVVEIVPDLLKACKLALSKMQEHNMLLPDNYLQRAISKAEGI